MKNTPPNNGKDVPEFCTHKIYSMDGFHHAIAQPKYKIKNKNASYYEPKRNNRWLIEFLGAYKDIPQWVLKETHRPRLINGNWGNFKIILRDNIGPSTAQAVIEGFRHEWQVKHNKIPRIEYSLEMLDPTGQCIEKWRIEGEVINADFGELNYEKDMLTEIKLEIEPSKVILLY
tara:strand:+ start:31685 stop:32206 length:522 start_codon:yes stop_codon:yes gene_type:complete